jgi:hypothetical protein
MKIKKGGGRGGASALGESGLAARYTNARVRMFFMDSPVFLYSGQLSVKPTLY